MQRRQSELESRLWESESRLDKCEARLQEAAGRQAAYFGSILRDGAAERSTASAASTSAGSCCTLLGQELDRLTGELRHQQMATNSRLEAVEGRAGSAITRLDDAFSTSMRIREQLEQGQGWQTPTSPAHTEPPPGVLKNAFRRQCTTEYMEQSDDRRQLLKASLQLEEMNRKLGAQSGLHHSEQMDKRLMETSARLDGLSDEVSRIHVLLESQLVSTEGSQLPINCPGSHPQAYANAGSNQSTGRWGPMSLFAARSVRVDK